MKLEEVLCAPATAPILLFPHPATPCVSILTAVPSLRHGLHEYVKACLPSWSHPKITSSVLYGTCFLESLFAKGLIYLKGLRLVGRSVIDMAPLWYSVRPNRVVYSVLGMVSGHLETYLTRGLPDHAVRNSLHTKKGLTLVWPENRYEIVSSLNSTDD